MIYAIISLIMGIIAMVDLFFIDLLYFTDFALGWIMAAVIFYSIEEIIRNMKEK